MKKSIVILSAILIAVAFFASMGFTQNTEQTIQNNCKSIVEEFTKDNVGFLEKISEKDAVNKGKYKFFDANYYYIVDPNEKYISSIITSKKLSEDTKEPIKKEDAQKNATVIFEKVMDKHITETITTQCEAVAGEGASYIFEVIEKINGIETGTKGLITMSADGSLLGAVFLKADADYKDKIKDLKTISETEAKEIAFSEIKKDIQEIDAAASGQFDAESKEYSATIKTFKGRTYWSITYPVVITTASGKTNDIFFIQVDAVSGAIIQTGKAAK